VVCERPLAAGLGLFFRLRPYVGLVLALFCIAVGPAFDFSDFDVTGGLGFAFDIFCVTLSFLASQSLWF